MDKHTGWFLPSPQDEDEALSILSRHEELSAAIKAKADELRSHGLSAVNIIDALEAEGLIGVVRDIYATDEENKSFELEERMNKTADLNRHA